jgi:hypothetical protein
MIAKEQAIADGFESARVLRSWNQRRVSHRAERDHNLIVPKLARSALRDGDTNDPPRYVDVLYRSLNKTHASEARTDRLCTMPQLQYSRARLEEKRSEKKEVVSADESDLDAGAATKAPIEMARRGKSADAPAKNDDSTRQRNGGVGLRFRHELAPWADTLKLMTGRCHPTFV